MVTYTTSILKFDEQGEKTGWTYIIIPADIAEKLMPTNKKSFRVKGQLDDYKFEQVSLLPMGKGDFILPVNGTIRKSIHKGEGAIVKVKMKVDTTPVLLDEDLMQCLHDEPTAFAFFDKLPKSHQNYYSRWIVSAKTEATKAKRIAQTVKACSKKMSYAEMMREEKELNKY